MNADTSVTEECACPVCATAATNDAEYFARAFGDARRFAATSESVTDALGFCPRHGASLLTQAQLSRGIVQVFSDAIPRIAPLLAEQYIYEDRVQQVFFGASNACPACAHGNRAATRHVGRMARQLSGVSGQAEWGKLDRLCVRHFQSLADALEPADRMNALRQYASTLDRAARRTRRALRSRRTLTALLSDGGKAALHPALRLIVGKPVIEPCLDDDALAGVLQRCPTIVETIAYPNACPVCIEVARARQRWIRDVPVAAEFQQIAWLFFPTCSEHVRAVACRGDSKLTAIVLAHALQAALGHIQQQILALVRAAEIEAELAKQVETAGIAHWGGRARRKAQSVKPISVRPTRCPGCERIVIAEDRATGSMLELLEQRKYRDAFNRGYGLCMKHYAQVYLLAPKGALRTALAEGQQGRLAAFAQMLDERTRADQEDAAAVPKEAPWRTAMYRFCGFA